MDLVYRKLLDLIEMLQAAWSTSTAETASVYSNELFGSLLQYSCTSNCNDRLLARFFVYFPGIVVSRCSMNGMAF